MAAVADSTSCRRGGGRGEGGGGGRGEGGGGGRGEGGGGGRGEGGRGSVRVHEHTQSC